MSSYTIADTNFINIHKLAISPSPADVSLQVSTHWRSTKPVCPAKRICNSKLRIYDTSVGLFIPHFYTVIARCNDLEIKPLVPPVQN